MTVYLSGAPPKILAEIEIPEGAIVVKALLREPVDFIHSFVTTRTELAKQFPILKSAILKDGIIWISWPKKAANQPTNLDENIVREIGLKNGLVDVKVVAVDDVWSGLKFVFRKEDRS